MSTLRELESQRASLILQLKNIDTQINLLSNASPFVKIGGVSIHTPSSSSGKQTITTAVDAGRNNMAEVIANKLGRDQSKLELSWSYLSANEWKQILDIFENSFVNTVEYYDMQKGERISRLMYVGDRSGRPFKVDAYRNPTGYLECQANLIDMGKGG